MPVEYPHDARTEYANAGIGATNRAATAVFFCSCCAGVRSVSVTTVHPPLDAAGLSEAQPTRWMTARTSIGKGKLRIGDLLLHSRDLIRSPCRRLQTPLAPPCRGQGPAQHFPRRTRRRNPLSRHVLSPACRAGVPFFAQHFLGFPDPRGATTQPGPQRVPRPRKLPEPQAPGSGCRPRSIPPASGVPHAPQHACGHALRRNPLSGYTLRPEHRLLATFSGRCPASRPPGATAASDRRLSCPAQDLARPTSEVSRAWWRAGVSRQPPPRIAQHFLPVARRRSPGTF
jgi:hypothetical protein